MKKIYILQMHTKTLPARFIKFLTRYSYSHIAISLDKNCNKIYSVGRKRYNNFLVGGFVEENKSGEFFKRFNNTWCRIYELEITNKQYKIIVKKINYMKNHEELFGYDYLGIVFRYFKIPIMFKNKYVCSYLIAKLLEDAKIYKFNKKTYFIEPKDFEKIPNMKEIYIGKYVIY